VDDNQLGSTGGISRRNVLKAAAAGGASIASISALAACTSGSSPSSTTSGVAGSTKSFTFMDHLIANVPAFESTHAAFKASAEALGSTAQFTSYDGDMQKAFSQQLTFPALGVNGVHTYLVADASLPQYAKNLTDKNIAVSDLSNRIPWFDPSDPKFGGNLIGIVQGPFAEEAYIVAKALFEAGGGSGKAIRLRGPKGGLSDNARGVGVDFALKEYPGVQVVATAYTDWDPTKGQKALEALLPQYPDVKFILTMNDGLAMGALATLKANRNTTALLMGCDGDPDFLAAMATEDRLIATSAGLIAFSGVLAATRLYDHLSGVKFNPLEAYVDTDSVIVDTKAAAAELLKLTGPNAPLLWDARKMSRKLAGDSWITQHHIQVGNPATFEWGDKPGTTPTPRPADFKFTDAYQTALDGGQIDKVNADWTARFKDPYGAVRAAAIHKDGALGEFKRKGII
jgi:ribose transport system substrate-binding protein